MNFDFLRECRPEKPELQRLYELIATELERAERKYWDKPEECGIILRGVAEKICRVYNIYYEIGCPTTYSLEEFLCYTDSETHNAMVSRFLSAVRKEQRDRLNKLRVLGDDCIWGESAPNRGMTYEDRMAQNAKRMMETMMELLKEMCKKIHKREDLQEIAFAEPDRTEQSEAQFVYREEQTAGSYKKIKEIIKKMFIVTAKEKC